MEITQKTDYPWNGNIQLTVTPDQSSEFALCLRVPGWAKGRPVPSDLYRFENTTVSPVKLKINGQAVDATFDAITDALKSGQDVKVIGFGNFSVAKRAASMGRNPRTGEAIKIAASNTPKFKAGKGLKDAVNS